MYTSKTPLRDFYGKIIGYIESDDEGNQMLRDFYGKILGKYEARSNITRDFYGTIIGRGNVLGILLQQETR